MHLLIIAPSCDPHSGSSLRVYNWIKMLKDRIKVSYLSTSQSWNPGIAHQFHWQSFPDNRSSKIRRLWTYYKTDFPAPKFAQSPDIVQIEGPHFFGLRRFFPNVPVVLNEHNVYWNLLRYDMASGPGVRRMPFKSLLLPWLQWRAKQYEKKALREADHAFVCSTNDQNEIVKELPELADRTTVIPNCLDLSLYHPSEGTGESILFIGSLDYSANGDALEMICREIAPRLPHRRFQIIGEGNGIPALAPNVHWLGSVPDIKPFLAGCRVFIVPLRFGSGTRFKILEAMAMQRPVLSTRKGAEGLEVRHGENIWIEDDWPSFTAAIERLWQNQEESVRIAARGRKFVETFHDYRTYAPKVVGIYQTLMGRKR